MSLVKIIQDIISFNKYLSSNYHVPGTVVGLRIMVMKTDRVLKLRESILQCEETTTEKKNGHIFSFNSHMLSLKSYKDLTIKGR